MKTKVCASCKVEKSAADFSPHKMCRDGLYSYCRNCARVKQRVREPSAASLPNEEWRPVPNWEALYEVSNLGRVKALERKTPCNNRWGETVQRRPERILKATMSGPYLSVGLNWRGVKRRRTVHRLVCEAFHGPCPSEKSHCAHSDGNPLNNNASNLRWASVRENAEDARRHGTMRVGERSNLSKVTEADVREIRRQAADGASAAVIANAYSFTAAGIQKIINRENWKHV